MTVRMVFRGAGLWDGAPALLADEWSEPPRSLAADRSDVFPFPVLVESVPAEGHLILLPDADVAYVVASVTHDFRRGLHYGPEVWLLLTPLRGGTP